MPRDWFYRSSIHAVAGGTVFATIFTVVAVYSQPRGKTSNPIVDLWDGRARELSFFNNRFDAEMYFYVVGGTMLSLNAMSGAAYHYQRFGADSNPGVFLYAAFFTFYVMDYFVKTPSSDGPSASFSASSSPNTSRPATARSCAADCGASRGTSTTWARGSWPCR